MIVKPSNVNYTDKDLIEYLGNLESDSVFWGDRWKDELKDRVVNGHKFVGAKMPWSKTEDKVRFRAGEVTLWAGMNGHFKSMILGQVMQWTALQENEAVGIMSFEMPVVDTMYRMLCQAADSSDPGAAYVDQWADWNNPRIAYYDKLDTTKSDHVLGVVFYMAKELGCKHIMIDSLTKCGLPYGERGAEKDFIDALCATAKAFDIHIHLVCHVRKPHSGGEEYMPTKFDVRGAGELTDLVHNVIICWADKKRKRLLNSNTALKPADEKYVAENTDQRLIVAKQRNGEFEGTIGLYMRTSLQFSSSEDRPMFFDMESSSPVELSHD